MINQSISKISQGYNLDFEETYKSVQEIINGQATEAQIAAFLMGLRVKGETAVEISGGAKCLIDHARKIDTRGSFCVDCVGTGGDSKGTFNISSAASLIAAAAGAKITKHGNRAVTSKCGSADFYEALGLEIHLEPEDARTCLENTNFTFLFAPVYHPAMKNAAPVRKQLGIHTLFNLLGPLSNPSRAQGILLGVYSAELLHFMAEVLQLLGIERAMVVHGHDGTDEISLTGKTDVCEISGNQIREYTFSPEDFGLSQCTLAEIAGGSAGDNAQIMTDIIKGKTGPYRDVVLLNAGAVLYIAGLAENIAQGIVLAARAVDSQAVSRILEQLQDFSREITTGRSVAL